MTNNFKAPRKTTTSSPSALHQERHRIGMGLHAFDGCARVDTPDRPSSPQCGAGRVCLLGVTERGRQDLIQLLRTNAYGRQLVTLEFATVSCVAKGQGERNYFFSSAASSASKLNFRAVFRPRTLGVNGGIFVNMLFPQHLEHKLISFITSLTLRELPHFRQIVTIAYPSQSKPLSRSDSSNC